MKNIYLLSFIHARRLNMHLKRLIIIKVNIRARPIQEALYKGMHADDDHTHSTIHAYSYINTPV